MPASRQTSQVGNPDTGERLATLSGLRNAHLGNDPQKSSVYARCFTRDWLAQSSSIRDGVQAVPNDLDWVQFSATVPELCQNPIYLVRWG